MNDDEPPSTSLPAAALRAQLYAAVDRRFASEQVGLLKALVELPSYTAARDDVERAASKFDEAMGQLGFQITRVPDPQAIYADHRVYCSATVGPSSPSLALVGHIDTVFPRALGFVDFSRDDGPQGPGTGDIVRGPGVLDMKSGLTSMVFAIAALYEVMGEKARYLPLRVICVSDEEVGSPSSAPLYESLAPQLTGALVFEAGRDRDLIVTARKGGGMFEFKVTGVAAHSGNAHAQGVNAIHALALLIPRIEALTDYSRGVTVNVGVISGGTSKNTVPGFASCQIDTRFDTMTDAAALIGALQNIADAPFVESMEVPERLRAVKVELSGHMTRPPMEACEASAQLRRRYEACAADVGLGIGEAPRQGGGSDGNLLAAAGVPAIDGLGPWGQHFHNPREFCSLESLRRRTQALACFLAQELGDE